MTDSIEIIRKELEAKHKGSAVRKSVEELTARCTELETQITEQEEKASQAFNAADITAYEEAVSRKTTLQEVLKLSREKLERQSAVPELSEAECAEYRKRIESAVNAEEEKQVKKLSSLIGQIMDCLQKNEDLGDSAEELDTLVREYMREPKATFTRTHVWEYLRSTAERLQMKIEDCSN
jgi:nicotinamide mononucleotide adenylyltransferase